ncbi:MAG: GNAT family N-acetyltransferase, partial [Acidobacteria bacterium]|nr:GNAT family N-acetyltransferase [Acidobacteriota bacterium]
MLPYPAEDEGTVLLRDGTPVFMRPMRAADAMALLRTYDRLSEETLYFRFFSVPPRDAKKAEYLADVDYDGRYALVAEVRGEIVAGARYERLAERPECAETAFTIEDAWQGRGLGSLLLERLVKAARRRGIATLEAELLVDNTKMLHVFEASGYPLSQRASSGVLHLEFGTARNAEADERAFARRVRGSAASARLVLAPKSIGVYGASRNPDKLGTRLLVGLASNGFNGPLVAVHPQSRSLAGVRCVPSLCDSEGFAAELAVICLPPSELPFALDDAARAGARAAVLVSSGYSETGPDGRVLEEAIVRRAHESGMRLLGPNSLGTINTKPEVRLFAGSARSPRRGHVALGTQSSALGLLALGDALRRGIGISSAAALGNKCDLGELELLAHWAEDPETRAVLLHLESFDDPEAFTRLARRAVKEKPVVVLHAGRSREGARAAASHTGALAPAGVHVTALLESAGVLVVQTFEELLDAAALFGAPV